MPMEQFDCNDELVKVLTKHKDTKRLSVFEILCVNAGMKLEKEFYLILDKAGRSINPSQILEYYGFDSRQAVKCPLCEHTLRPEELFVHLNQDYKKGHKLSISKIIPLFKKRTDENRHL